MSRSGRFALMLRGVLTASVVAASTGAMAADGGAGPFIEPILDCSAELKWPRLVATSPAVLPETVWAAKTGWEAIVRFRVDATGAPDQVAPTIISNRDDTEQLERLTAETFSRYRFCAPGDFSTQATWRATVRFVYRHLELKTGTDDMFIQMFAPTYTADDVATHRTGVTRVAASYGPDGRTKRMRITSSSGIRVLDDKTLESVATNQLVFHDGTAERFPLTFDTPYNYQIR